MNNRNLDAMYHCFVIATLTVGGLLTALILHSIIESFFGIDNEQEVKIILTIFTIAISSWYVRTQVYKNK